MADRIADLILEKGHAKARGHARSGAIFADAIQQGGQIAGQMFGQIQEGQAAARESKAIRDLMASGATTPEQWVEVLGPERGVRVAQGLAALRPDPVKDFQNRQAILRDTILGMHALPEDVRAEQWPQARQNLIDRKLLTEQDAPATYDPAFFQRLTSHGQEPKAPEKPERTPTKTITVRNPDGTETTQIVEDAPGQSFTSAAVPEKPSTAPKLGSEEDYLARLEKSLGQPLTPAQIETARRKYAASTRFVEPKAPAQPDDERIVKDGQIRDVPKAKANEFFAQGWKPYNETTNRTRERDEQKQTDEKATADARTTARSTIGNLAMDVANDSSLSDISGTLIEGRRDSFLLPGNAEALRKYNELLNKLVLERRGDFKGQGAVSNYEQQTVEKAVGLSRKVGAADLRKKLLAIASEYGAGASSPAAPQGPPGWSPADTPGYIYVPKPGGGWTAVEAR